MDHFGIFNFAYVEVTSHFACCKIAGILPFNANGNGKICSTIIPAIFMLSVIADSNKSQFGIKLLIKLLTKLFNYY